METCQIGCREEFVNENYEIPEDGDMSNLCDEALLEDPDAEFAEGCDPTDQGDQCDDNVDIPPPIPPTETTPVLFDPSSDEEDDNDEDGELDPIDDDNENNEGNGFDAEQDEEVPGAFEDLDNCVNITGDPDWVRPDHCDPDDEEDEDIPGLDDGPVVADLDEDSCEDTGDPDWVESVSCKRRRCENVAGDPNWVRPDDCDEEDLDFDIDGGSPIPFPPVSDDEEDDAGADEEQPDPLENPAGLGDIEEPRPDPTVGPPALDNTVPLVPVPVDPINPDGAAATGGGALPPRPPPGTGDVGDRPPPAGNQDDGPGTGNVDRPDANDTGDLVDTEFSDPDPIEEFHRVVNDYRADPVGFIDRFQIRCVRTDENGNEVPYTPEVPDGPLRPLNLVQELSDAAQHLAEFNFENQVVGHTDDVFLNGGDAPAHVIRANHFGYPGSFIIENANGWLPGESLEQAMQRWICSTDVHNQNLLNSVVTDAGFGLVEPSDGGFGALVFVGGNTVPAPELPGDVEGQDDETGPLQDEQTDGGLGDGVDGGVDETVGPIINPVEPGPVLDGPVGEPEEEFPPTDAGLDGPPPRDPTVPDRPPPDPEGWVWNVEEQMWGGFPQPGFHPTKVWNPNNGEWEDPPRDPSDPTSPAPPGDWVWNTPLQVWGNFARPEGPPPVPHWVWNPNTGRWDVDETLLPTEDPVVGPDSNPINEIIDLVNEYRESKGLQPLEHNQVLSDAAQHVANDNDGRRMKSHFDNSVATRDDVPFVNGIQSPAGFRANHFGYPTSHVWENLGSMVPNDARNPVDGGFGPTTPALVVQGWKESVLHDFNMQIANATHIGVGWTDSNVYINVGTPEQAASTQALYTPAEIQRLQELGQI